MNINILLFGGVFSVLVLFNSVEFSYAQDIYGHTEKTLLLYAEYKEGAYQNPTTEVIFGEHPYWKELDGVKGGHNGVVVSFQGEALGYFGFLSPKMILCWDKVEQGKVEGGCEDWGMGDIHVSAPYFPNARYVDLYDPQGKKLIRIDVSGLAICNEDGSCSPSLENLKTCPSDCQEDSLGDPQRRDASTTGIGGGLWKPWMVFAIVLGMIGVLIFVGYIFLDRRMNRLLREAKERSIEEENTQEK